MGKRSNSHLASVASTLIKVTKLGSLDKPITDLTHDLWKTIERDRTDLVIDLFQPVNIEDHITASKQDETSSKEKLKPSDSDSSILPPSSLQPLLQFRQLHHLTLTGMLESYQPLIWATCWLQPFLKTVHLEMALPPFFNLDTDHPHHFIDTTWALNNSCRCDPNLSEYLGHHGEGTLHDEFGDGEYLDSQAIKMAQQEVAKDLPFNNLRYLPVENLTLMNFVVDGGSIMRWFDPKRLKELEFREGCIDAGLYLREDMERTKIISPKPRPLHQFARVIKLGEVKTAELKNGKVVTRKDGPTRKEEFQGTQKQPGLKAKVSQLMHGFGGGKNKENKPVEKKDDNVKDIENGFSEMEIRAAKDGKKPVRD